jgi:RNA polymerase sigma-70 factor (ECF subfamily)
VPWAELFLAHAGDARDALARAPELESLLAGHLDAARAEWPDVVVPPEAFLRHVAERLPAGRDPVEALRQLHAADLYLACACARGDARALQMFETKHLAPMAGYVSRSDALPAFTDELKQALRARLLVAREGLLPKIGGYTGQGPLGAWLRITASRVAFDLRESERGHLPLDEDRAAPLASAGSPRADPEISYLKSRYASEFEAAFRATLEKLSRRERNVLRHYYLDAMTADAIAKLYRVSLRTMQRWLTATRTRILRATRELLAERLDLSSTQIDGLMMLVQSQFEMSVFQILRSRGE